ncbi:hypothetical protein E2C01_020528 [Portunus trituberculatus]|uniref:Uncharacterized protein n=1 Tax=Portunus trituberculatus TaxID=210409 RepID=A0A5B7E0C8_PORTR|nr:hypothetical protein [Portunus trituberculatus]
MFVAWASSATTQCTLGTPIRVCPRRDKGTDLHRTKSHAEWVLLVHTVTGVLLAVARLCCAGCLHLPLESVLVLLVQVS